MKIILLGSRNFGKDHAAEYINKNFGISYRGSSELCSEIFIFDKLKDKYGYKTAKQCFEDRINHRPEWHQLICEYNKDDLTRLAAKIFQEHEMYCGMRCKHEVNACKEKWADLLVIYIDRYEVLPLESTDSCTITKELADIIISNNSDIPSFEGKLRRLFYNIKG